MWMLALHVVLMDRVLEEPYTLTVFPYSASEFKDYVLPVRPGRPVTTSVLNNVDQTVGVGLMPIGSGLVETVTVYSDTVSSIDQHGTGAVEVLFDVARWNKEAKAAILPVLARIMEYAVQEALDELGVSIAWDVKNPAAVKFLSERAQRFAERIDETTWEDLRARLAEGIDAGESIKELEERVQQ